MTLMVAETTTAPTAPSVQLIEMLNGMQRLKHDDASIPNAVPIAWVGKQVEHTAPHFESSAATDARTMGWVVYRVLELASSFDDDVVEQGFVEAAIWRWSGMLSPDLSATLDKIV